MKTALMKRVLLLVPVALGLAGFALVASAQQADTADQATSSEGQARKAAAEQADRTAAEARRDAARRAAEEARKAREAAAARGAQRPAEREEEEDWRR